MGIRIGNITFDCANPDRMAEFWGAAMGYVKQEPPPQVVEFLRQHPERAGTRAAATTASVRVASFKRCPSRNRQKTGCTWTSPSTTWRPMSSIWLPWGQRRSRSFGNRPETTPGRRCSIPRATNSAFSLNGGLLRERSDYRSERSPPGMILSLAGLPSQRLRSR